MNDSYIDDRKLHEECGVFGAYDFDCGDVASTIYYGLFALQHRGQESCGIAVSDTEGPKGKVLSHKDMGLVNEVTQVIARQLNVNIRKLTIETEDGIFEGKIQLWVHDVDDVKTICNNLKKIQNIKQVSRVEE